MNLGSRVEPVHSICLTQLSPVPHPFLHHTQHCGSVASHPVTVARGARAATSQAGAGQSKALPTPALAALPRPGTPRYLAGACGAQLSHPCVPAEVTLELAGLPAAAQTSREASQDEQSRLASLQIAWLMTAPSRDRGPSADPQMYELSDASC